MPKTALRHTVDLPILETSVCLLAPCSAPGTSEGLYRVIMGITLRSNLLSMNAIRRLGDSSRTLGLHLERLSSGSRLNRPSDDSAGVAVATGLNARVRIYTQAVRNVNDSLSLLNVAQGAMGELSGVSIRIKELAQQAANGSLSIFQRRALNKEAQELVGEFNRIIGSTQFNGLNIFSATTDPVVTQLGFGTEESIAFNSGHALRRASGTGAFGSINSVANFGAIAGEVIMTDLNGDGNLDLVGGRTGNSFAVSLGAGDGTFAVGVSVATLLSAGSITSVQAGDINHDGLTDIVVGGVNGQVQTLFGNGTGTTFTQGSVSTIGSGSVGKGRLGDFDGDGQLDFIGRNGASIFIARGNANGTFSSFATLNNGGESVGDIELGDFNADGRIDFVTSSTASATGRVYMGSGSGSFSLGSTFSSLTSADFAVDDLNADGLDDIAVESGAIFLSGGDGTFQTGTSFTSSGTGAVRLADFNVDGIQDVLRYNGTQIQIFFGSLSGNYTAGAIKSITTSGSFFGAVGDTNGDGVPDFAGGAALSGAGSWESLTEETTNTAYVDLLSRENALEALDLMDSVLTRIANEHGAIGAAQSRLSAALGTVNATRENSEAARSRIADADVASESAGLVRAQILQQVVSAILGQANQQPALALRLLRS